MIPILFIVITILVGLIVLVYLHFTDKVSDLRDKLGTETDRSLHYKQLYMELESVHSKWVVQATKDIWLAEQKGFNDAKEQVFTESGEIRHGFGPLVSIDPFTRSSLLPKGTDDPKLEKFIERARNDFLIEQYREGYGIRSEVKTTMVRFEDSFSTGPRARFMFMAMGTPLVAPPEDSNQEVSWLIHRARIDTDSVDVRPHKE